MRDPRATPPDPSAPRCRAASLSPRGRLLQKLLAWPHRYELYRLAALALTLGMLLAVPLLGLARFDAWGAGHLMLRRRVTGFEGLVAITAGMAVFYGVTFVLNALVGRLFCGWGCPVAQVARFGEEAEIARKSGKGTRGARLKALSFGAALSASVLLWWVDPRVLLEGSPLEVAAVLAVFLALLGATLLHGRWWRWSFCKRVCPIGLYYSVVAPERIYGVVFERGRGPCKDCHVCARVCPVDLDPRDLSRPRVDIGGLAVDGLPAENHCLRCGDCIRACEWIFRESPDAAVPLRFDFIRRAGAGAVAAPRPEGGGPAAA